MRLLEVLSNGDIRLTEKFFDKAIPPYAILSHTWGSQEVTYDDMVRGSGRDKAGYEKIKFCSEQAAKDGLKYFWVDSCAIDKSSSAELQESITSMFRYYKCAAKCYVYLSDVSMCKGKEGEDNLGDTWEQTFRESRWFTRGWTLQELLAPTLVQFFSKESRLLGDKQSLKQDIQEITGIPISALLGSALSLFSTDQKMDWAKNRKTTREEDWAYSLMGIFEISMLVNYGEGRASAVRRLRKEIEDASKDKECLRHLYVTNPRADKTRIEETKGGLIQDSYRWVLENCDFKQWRNNQQNNLLWIKGDPGKGKTMLLCGVIDELEQPIVKTYNLSYFFCQATDSRINNATAVLRGLLYLLVGQQSSLISHIQKQHDHAGKALFEDVNAWFTLSDIFTNILQDPNLQSTYFIIDALDECTVHLPRLLDFILQKSSVSPHVKWLVSSRNWPSIEERLGQTGNKVGLSLELNSESISAAVGVYIRHQVCKLAQEKNYNNKTRDTVLDYLFSNADDTFLWVALVCENLKNIPRGRILARLNSFPPGLDYLYGRMMKQICESEDSELCKRILASMATVYEPITVLGLVSVVEMLEESSNDLESLKEIVKLCGSFLVIRNDTIFFVHQSAKDYLLGKASVEIFPFGKGKIHYEIFSRSLKVLSGTLRRDIYGLSSAGCLVEKAKKPHPDPLLASRYSSIYWVDHLFDQNPECQADQMLALQDEGVVDMFIKKKFLYWLEALGLCGGMSKGLVAMVKLEALIKERTYGSSLAELVQDARRFMIYSKQAIEASPLQAYVSALLFSPASSLIRHCFQKEHPEWIRIMLAKRDSSDASLQTLDGHNKQVKFVTFSQDSTRLASASVDGIIKVWNTSSGECLLTLEYYMRIKLAAFSCNSAELVSVSEDGTVHVWNVRGGECLRTLKVYGSNSSSPVAFSHDLGRFGLASQRRSVQVWDASSWKYIQTLEGLCDSFGPITFSHDSTKLASTLKDSTIQIWDIHSRQCLLTLKGLGDQVVQSLFFSHDSTQLASNSRSRWLHEQGYHHMIKIWDLSSGNCLQTFTIFRDRVLSIVFTYNLKQLLLTEHFGKVTVWDISSGKSLQVLKYKGYTVSSWTLSYSTDLIQVALASEEGISVWDIDSGQRLQTLKLQINWATSVAFSNNGKLLASVNLPKISVWNLDSGECIQTLVSHSSRINAVIFSQDSTKLVSANEGTVEVWNIDSGNYLQALESYSTSFDSVAFSQDSTLLLLEACNPTIKVWDTSKVWDLSNSECLQTLEGHSSFIKLVTFSHDSKRLASASDRIVKVWNIDSGRCIQTIEHHDPYILGLVITNDSGRLASQSHREVKFWDIENGECLQTFTGEGWVLTSLVAFSHDSARLVSVFSTKMYIWDVGSGELLQKLEGHSANITSIAFSNDSTRLISASYDSTVKIWDTDSGKYPPILVPVPECHSDCIRAVVFSYDSTRLVSTSVNRTIKLWDTNNGACLQTFKARHSTFGVVAFSHDSTHLILGWSSGVISVWNIRNSECLWTIQGHSESISSIAIPYRATRFVSVADDFTVKVWDLRSGYNIYTFDTHENYARAVAFSHDLTWLALALDDETIRIWDANSGECLQTLKGHSDIASSVAFSYDSTQLASSSSDGTVRIWDISSSECLKILNVGRTLHNISFNDSGLYIYTDIGTFAVNAVLTSNTAPDQIKYQNPECIGLGLNSTREWITYNSKKLVWIPSEYRPSHSAVSGRTIGCGVESGEVWMCTLEDPNYKS